MSGSKTDDDILANVPGLEDENDDNSNEAGGSEGGGEQGSGEGNSQQTNNNQTTQTENDPRIVKRTDGLVERANAANPRVRDLVDPMTGQVVAQGGIERRIYEQSKRHERDAGALRRENEQLKAQANGYQHANTLATQLGLPPEEQATAFRVLADFKKDPVRTIEYLIAEVKAKGHNIPSLMGQGQATDTEALAKLLDQRLAPLMQERQQSQRVAQANQNAKRELDNFLDQAPDARANLDILAEMITGDQSLNLNSAYIRFLTWCSANQLDPTQHVGPQLQARQQQAQAPATQPRQTRPLPGNRQTNGAIPVGARATHDENSEWSSIINDSMVEAGYNR
jgi:hypothetical protein